MLSVSCSSQEPPWLALIVLRAQWIGAPCWMTGAGHCKEQLEIRVWHCYCSKSRYIGSVENYAQSLRSSSKSCVITLDYRLVNPPVIANRFIVNLQHPECSTSETKRLAKSQHEQRGGNNNVDTFLLRLKNHRYLRVWLLCSLGTSARKNQEQGCRTSPRINAATELMPSDLYILRINL